MSRQGKLYVRQSRGMRLRRRKKQAGSLLSMREQPSIEMECRKRLTCAAEERAVSTAGRGSGAGGGGRAPAPSSHGMRGHRAPAVPPADQPDARPSNCHMLDCSSHARAAATARNTAVLLVGSAPASVRVTHSCHLEQVLLRYFLSTPRMGFVGFHFIVVEILATLLSASSRLHFDSRTRGASSARSVGTNIRRRRRRRGSCGRAPWCTPRPLGLGWARGTRHDPRRGTSPPRGRPGGG